MRAESKRNKVVLLFFLFLVENYSSNFVICQQIKFYRYYYTRVIFLIHFRKFVLYNFSVMVDNKYVIF